ncbi:sugar dehydrogenase complex small subunit [Cereibacter sp. SYSU M97828]|nr:sugar dehydrogenase complex small subunit [Cereibacter flavus]
MKPHSQIARVNRRQLFLLGTAAMLASAMPSFTFAATQDIESRFMGASQLLVNHDLSPAVGARIAAFAQASYPNLGDMLDRITETAATRGASRVEDFFDAIPEGELRDFAFWVISAWYTGSSSGDRDATLFTYEEALLYQPTIDMVPIPTFGFSAPNAWGNDLYPLTDLPRF